ncbi:ankyrin repeat domain-containing protein [Shinella sp.]|uniref:ankyrin repeat domain-containing protein n=1 Tax=Shinella sp. TaxID=1870904 RepID=UPI0039E36B4A
MKQLLLRILIVVVAAMLTVVVDMQAVSAASGPAKVFTDPRIVEIARAIEDGNKAEVRRLVQEGANVAAQGQKNVTLLQWAMLRDQPRMMELLLELGADPSQRGFSGQTALHMAAQAKRRPYLAILLDHGADPNVRGGSTEAPVLSEAIMNGNHDAVSLLLKHRADPNAANRQNETPLHVAALVNDYGSMLALLEAGVDPTIRDRGGRTFAAYFAIKPKESMMSWEAKRGRKAVQDWLASHGHGGAQ